MTGSVLLAPVFRAVDVDGEPISGALLQFYLSGTTTPTPVYTDKTLGTPLSNPVESDSAGLFPPIFLDPTITYRAQLLDASSALIENVDPVAQPFAPTANSITAAMLQAGVALANLGYTPVNKAGDTATNLVLAFTALAVNSAGYLGAPVNEQDANYVLALGDAGKMVRGNGSGAITYTIPPNSSVAFPIGAAIVFRNIAASAITITRGAGVTLTIAGSGTSKDVALAQWGLATAIQETANNWVINGAGTS